MDEMLLWIEAGDDSIPISRAVDYEDAVRQRAGAVAHGRATGRAVQLVKYVRHKVLEEIEP